MALYLVGGLGALYLLKKVGDVVMKPIKYLAEIPSKIQEKVDNKKAEVHHNKTKVMLDEYHGRAEEIKAKYHITS